MLQMFRSPKQHMALGSVLLYPIKDSFLQHNTPQGPTSFSWRFSSRVTPPWSVLPPLHLLYLPPLDWLQSKSWIYLVVLFLMHLSPSTKMQICWEQVLFQTCLCISSAASFAWLIPDAQRWKEPKFLYQIVHKLPQQPSESSVLIKNGPQPYGMLLPLSHWSETDYILTQARIWLYKTCQWKIRIFFFDIEKRI